MRKFEVKLSSNSKHQVFDGKGRIDIVVRPHGAGRIVTVTLANVTSMKVGEKERVREVEAESAFFESELRCFIPSSAVRNYPRVNYEFLSEEERELELRYKDERVYAIGHGVAVDWVLNKSHIEIFSDFMPIVEVPQVTANTGNSEQVLSFQYLMDIEKHDEVYSKLEAFVDAYEDWIERQEGLCVTESHDERAVAERLINRMHEAKSRMKSSISWMKQDEDAKFAFAAANKAMQMQMDLNGPAPAHTPYAWRPFQLAFFLMTLKSSVDEDDDYRDLVDLIWFPTGGGKTEAYLGVMAFVFAYRRLTKSCSGGGTTAIMRYTLRLLTSQQFVRACKVVSALELIRRRTDKLGDEAFSVGLWLGSASSPNSYNQAMDAVVQKNYKRFILERCPWCSCEFGAENFLATENSFNFICTNHKCELGCNGTTPPAF